MRICVNCGAELEDHVMVCPYCGTENFLKAYEEHKEELHDIRERTEDVKHLKERIARKATKVTGYVIAGVAVFFLLLILFTLVYGRIRAATALGRQNTALEELESMYQNGQYSEMYTYLDHVDNGYSSTFEKYYRVGSLCYYMESNVDYANDIYEYIQKDDRGNEFVSSALYFVFDCLAEAQQYEEEGFPYGEEEGVRYVQEAYRKALEPYGITDEEFREGIAIAANGGEEEDFVPLAETLCARMKAESK